MALCVAARAHARALAVDRAVAERREKGEGGRRRTTGTADPRTADPTRGVKGTSDFLLPGAGGRRFRAVLQLSTLRWIFG